MFGTENHKTSHNSNAIARDGSAARARYDNAMTAHVWAQGRQSFGASGNGNLYFHGPALFSYGSHFVVGLFTPSKADATTPGLYLIASDSPSVSTSGHVGDARRAAPGNPVRLPNLDRLARIVEAAIATGATETDAAGFPVAITWGNVARYAGPRLKEHFSNPANLPGGDSAFVSDCVDAVARVFDAMGCDNPERRARVAVDAARRAVIAEEEKEKADAKAKALRDLASAAKQTPEEVNAAMEAEARDPHAMRLWMHHRSQWERRSKVIFRAIKAGKAAGRSAQVRKAQAVRKAIRENLGTFEAHAGRTQRRERWGKYANIFRAGLRLLNGPHPEPSESIYRGRGGPNRTDGYVRADALQAAAEAAADLAKMLGHRGTDSRLHDDWTGNAASAARVGLGAMAAHTLARDLVDSFVPALKAAQADAIAIEERREAKGRVAALKAARDLMRDPEATARDTEGAAATLGAAVKVLDRHATRSYSATPMYAIPGAFRVCGWTPEKFAAVRSETKAAWAELNRRAKEEKAALAGIDAAAALAAWRAGLPMPESLVRPGSKVSPPDAMEGGAAYVRAVDVKRDDSGAIVGGELETSQGARVPLTHAIRVFRFLKACRDAGRGWRANGRTIRVGPFNVDAVSPDGSFIAGCHSFQWEEIADCAARLGLSDIAPAADVPEPRAYA